MNLLNRRDWLVRLSQFAAAVTGLSIKWPRPSAHCGETSAGAKGLWWSVDDPGEFICRDGEPVEFIRGKIVDVRSFDRALSPTEVSHVAWFMSRGADSAPIFRESPAGSGVRFIESEMTVIETPDLKTEVP